MVLLFPLANAFYSFIFLFFLFSLYIYIYCFCLESEGKVKRKELDYLFYDIKRILERNNHIEIKEKKFYNCLLNLTSKAQEEFISINEIKLTFFEILKGNITNEEIEKFVQGRILPDIDYLKKLSGVGKNYTNDFEKIMMMNNKEGVNNAYNSTSGIGEKLSYEEKLREEADLLFETGRVVKRTDSEIANKEVKENYLKKSKPIRSRKDIFTINTYFKPREKNVIILNENKLESIYK